MDFGGALKKSEDYRIALIGVPFDEKSCFLRGAAKGPDAIRAASSGKAINPWTELGINLEEETVIVDLGNIDVKGSADQVFSHIEERVGEILERKAVPVILGGDHSITYPVIRAFSRKFSSLDILHFDAHPDLYDELYGDRYSHACPFARIIEEGLVSDLVQVGIRAATGDHQEKASKYMVRTLDMDDVDKTPLLEFASPLYVSFDLDALDPAFAPGVSHHEPGGLSTRQAIKIIHSLKARIVGLDVVELNPDRDQSDITAAAAVKIIMEVMGKIVVENKYQRSKHSQAKEEG
ncbi:MAG: agmatinase [Candidatus Aminicenantales bacterium]